MPFDRITTTEIQRKGVQSAPDKLTGTAAENKKVFDKAIEQVVAVHLNDLMDALEAETGAGEIGSTVSGLEGETVQAILTALKALRDSDVSSQTAANISVQTALENRYTKDQTDAKLALKFDTATANSLVKSISFNGDTGVFTITTQGGSVSTIDTLLEKVPATFSLEGNKLVLTLEDGTKQEADLSAFIDTYTFSDSATVGFSQTGKTVSAQVLDGSLTLAKLDSTAQSTLAGYADRAEAAESGAETAQTAAEAAKATAQSAATTATTKAGEASASQQAAQNAKTAAETARDAAQASAESIGTSADDAAASATQAESYAKGGTGSRTGESTDNAKYYCEQAREYKEQAGEIVGGDFATKSEAQGYAATAKTEAIAAAATDATTKANAAKTAATEAAAADATTKANAAEANAKAASVPLTQKGAAGGVAELDSSGKVPADQLPAMNYDPAGSAAAVQANLTTHSGNTDVHVTSSEKTGWNGKQAKIRYGTITMAAASWTGEGPYTQTVTSTLIGANTQIDLNPDNTVLDQMETDGVSALFIQNNNGTATAVARGAAPTADLTVNATFTEVSV